MNNVRQLIKRTALVGFGSYATLVGAGYGVFYLAMNWSAKQKRAGISASLKENTPDENQWYLNQQRQAWSIETPDGLTLRATFIAGYQPSRGVVILAHGLHHAREQMIPWARLMIEQGFSVLMPDARAHGRSDGNVIGYGWLDRKDYQQWINTVIERCGSAVPIVLLGISMGATTVMATSGQALPKNVKAIIEDSGYRSVFQEGKFRLWHKYHVPSTALMPIANSFAKHLAGYAFREGDILAQVSQNRLPILMIHGGQDQTVPVQDAYALYDAANDPKQLMIDEQAPHIRAIRTHPDRYRRTVIAFLIRSLDH